MRAIGYDRFGAAAEVLQLSDLPEQGPRLGEVCVELAFSGVTKPPFPRVVPHSDGAGVIASVGAGVDPAHRRTRLGLERPMATRIWHRSDAHHLTSRASGPTPRPDQP